MKTSIIFSLAYFGGVALGLIGGHLLPWWASGVVGWSVAIVGVVVNRLAVVTLVRRAAGLSRSQRIYPLFAHLMRQRQSRMVTIGTSFGAFAGAAAVDASEVLDALVWPGHEVDGSILAMLVALAWLLGVVVSDEDDATFRPWVCGLGLYLFTLALTVLPAVWEVL
jgi:hypothetical protein